MKKVYVSHPYGGKEENKVAAEEIIKSLTPKDYDDTVYISPIHALGFLYDTVSYHRGMWRCLELLKMCDELLLCEGWENSRGCKWEKAYAETHGIPIIYKKTME